MITTILPVTTYRSKCGRHIARLALTAFLAWVQSSEIAGQTLFTYAFNDVTTISGRSSAGGASGNVQFGSFTATATLSANSNATGIFAFGSWVPGGATDQSDAFTGGLDPAEYYEFTITPDPGHSLTITGISLSAGRTATGPRQFVLRSDADAYAANLAASAVPPLSVAVGNILQFTDNAATNLVAGQSFTLSGADFSDLLGSRTFRLYAFNAEGSGTLRIDDVAILGSVSAVPESATASLVAALAALAGTAAVRRLGRRRAAATEDC